MLKAVLGILNHKEMGITKKKIQQKSRPSLFKKLCLGRETEGRRGVRILQLELELRGVGARRGEEPHRDGEKR